MTSAKCFSLVLLYLVVLLTFLSFSCKKKLQCILFLICCVMWARWKQISVNSTGIWFVGARFQYYVLLRPIFYWNFGFFCIKRKWILIYALLIWYYASYYLFVVMHIINKSIFLIERRKFWFLFVDLILCQLLFICYYFIMMLPKLWCYLECITSSPPFGWEIFVRWCSLMKSFLAHDRNKEIDAYKC